MDPLYSPEKAVKFGVADYSETFPYHCPDDQEWLCTFMSKSAGICKRDPDQCDTDTEGSLPRLTETDSTIDERKGAQYGYRTDHLADNCDRVTVDLVQTLPGVSPLSMEPNPNADADTDTDADNDVLPSKVLPAPLVTSLPEEETFENFKIMTYNIWGLLKTKPDPDFMHFQEELMKIRMRGILETIRRNDPDIVCLQEVTNPAYDLLSELRDLYPYHYEEDFNIERDRQSRKRDVEVLVFTRYRPKKITLHSLSGNLGYTNSFLTLEFQDVVIFNCYLQAGSRYSPGQQPHWFHYSRCRRNELREIGALADKFVTNGKAIVLVGDFNCDLNGDTTSWPELTAFREAKVTDMWRRLRPDDPGYTEDTDVNLMRWNLKFLQKLFRYDGILYRNPPDNEILKPLEIKVTGRKPIVLGRRMSDDFIRFLVPRDRSEGESNVRYYDERDRLIGVWPSDHFAVVGAFRVVEEEIRVSNREIPLPSDATDLLQETSVKLVASSPTPSPTSASGTGDRFLIVPTPREPLWDLYKPPPYHPVTAEDVILGVEDEFPEDELPGPAESDADIYEAL